LRYYTIITQQDGSPNMNHFLAGYQANPTNAVWLFSDFQIFKIFGADDNDPDVESFNVSAPEKLSAVLSFNLSYKILAADLLNNAYPKDLPRVPRPTMSDLVGVSFVYIILKSI
jgi:hypothetical protein